MVLVLAILVWYRISHHSFLLWIAGGLVLAGLFVPVLADGIHHAWMKLSVILGAVTSRILLTLIFFVVIVPLGQISRMFGKNELLVPPGQDSLFKIKDHLYTREDLEQPW